VDPKVIFFRLCEIVLLLDVGCTAGFAGGNLRRPGGLAETSSVERDVSSQHDPGDLH
jgi:hypothetical protein